MVALQETKLSEEGLGMVVNSQLKDGWQIAGAQAKPTMGFGDAAPDARRMSAGVAVAVASPMGMAYPSEERA